MKNDIIERYIYATTKRLPNKMKDDVSQELHGLIDDMLMERCGDVTPTEKDIKVVLTELGTPDELYNKYSPDGDKCLIGAPYYSMYTYVLKIVLICAGLGSFIVTVIDSLTDFFATTATGAEFATLEFFITFFKEFWITVPSVMITAFTIITILFAIFYQKGIKISSSGNLDDLPPVPKKKAKISKADSIVGIIISVVFLCVFLIAPQVFCIITSDPFNMVPLFNTETIHSLWYVFVLFSVLGIGREIVKLIEGRYNTKVMITTIVTDVASGILTVWWLVQDNIMNPQFASVFSSLFEGEKEFIVAIFSNFSVFFMAVILMALAIDVIVTVVKTLIYK